MIPIFVQNLSKSDCHMIVKILHKFGDGTLKIIPRTNVEYIFHFLNNRKLTAVVN